MDEFNGYYEEPKPNTPVDGTTAGINGITGTDTQQPVQPVQPPVQPVQPPLGFVSIENAVDGQQYAQPAQIDFGQPPKPQYRPLEPYSYTQPYTGANPQTQQTQQAPTGWQTPPAPPTPPVPPQSASSFYEQSMPDDPKPDRKGGIGGYIITAVVAFMIGVLVTSLLLPGIYAAFEKDREGGSAVIPQSTPVPTDEADGLVPGNATAEPATPTPNLTPADRETPNLDGQAPEVDPSVAISALPDIIEAVSDGVVGVQIYEYDQNYGKEIAIGSGSGFVISSDGYIVTNAHVVDGAERVVVMFNDGTEIDAEVIGTDKTMDVAVLKISGHELKPLKLGDSSAMRVGDFVIAIGDPTGRELAGTTTFGIISALARDINIDGVTNTYLQTDAAINPGNSGGPLLNMKGEVVGITSAKTVTASYDINGNAISAEGLGFALPMNEAMNVVNELVTVGYVRRPGIGISVIAIGPDTAAYYDVPQGISVYSVTKGGPGEKAGLKVNDIIVECEGEQLFEQEDFVAFVKAHIVGDSLTLKVYREGEYFETEIVLGDLNLMGNEVIEGTFSYDIID